MIQVIIGTSASRRVAAKEKLFSIIGTPTHSIDDSMIEFSALETYSYPSLFSSESLVVVASFLLEHVETLEKELLQTLAASPNVFILIERSIKASEKKILEKAGAIIIETDSTEKKPKTHSLFDEVSALCTIVHPRDRWLLYIDLLSRERPEAMLGILYWKLRDLSIRISAKQDFYRTFYRDLIEAHGAAWKKGTPLALAIEKVLLTR